MKKSLHKVKHLKGKDSSGERIWVFGIVERFTKPENKNCIIGKLWFTYPTRPIIVILNMKSLKS
ncbi:hypothetical protein BpHYR1_006730 [Brachionus plicatilis]|uniref:Uncharacterized protein n=1 Tax=Brachionus plicatilis TaxID=10195 RepID=A0A3M7PJB4_BRAPC|nr:hypothetical protein BpHYR1_006730 [Brachionus plicatilis]